MQPVDLYAVLGVLPTAEAVVITAAYRALAQRYHPDRWTGDPRVAHERMSAANAAYATLGDAGLRAAYDRARAGAMHGDFAPEGDADQAAAFDSALEEVEQRWQKACSIYPDLADQRARLHRISAGLAFAFVTLLLETRGFGRRADIAAQIEVLFLQRYFGTNSDVLTFAKRLIFTGQRQAAKALNDLVEVLGSDVEPALLIARIEEDFNLRAVWTKLEQDRLRSLLAGHSNENLRKYQNFAAAVELVEALGYKLDYFSIGMFRDTEVVLTAPDGVAMRFRNNEAFRQWAIKTLC